jgi:hypothetical protein
MGTNIMDRHVAAAVFGDTVEDWQYWRNFRRSIRIQAA